MFALRRLMEKYSEGQKELLIVFIDIEKAYDRVPRQDIWRCLRERGTPEKYVRLIRNMYEGAGTQIRTSVGFTETFGVGVWLHQGSSLSPYLFNIVIDVITERVREQSPRTKLFADDIVLCDETREELEGKLEIWKEKLESRGLKVMYSVFVPFLYII
ncbi:uncharacterized protein [Palaemon carinicauda]|uniref:uncharacterized protein n=1 Tax=Palaemon carinicauda TaxID=392227 RepID=UPI0035B64043